MAKIAFIDVTATVSYGGIQTAIWSLAHALTAAGHAVTVVGGASETLRSYPDEIRRLTFPYVLRERFPNLGTRFRKLAERLSFAYCARKSVEAEKFDWIILTKPFDFFWTKIIGTSGHTRFAFMSGGTDFVALDRQLAPRISAWLACSHFNAWQIRTRYKRFATVIFNGVDTTLFKPSQDRSNTRQALGFAETDVVFAYAGRMVGWKGVAKIVEALAQLDFSATPAKLLLIGEGPNTNELKALGQRLGVLDRIVFHPTVSHSELPAYYAACDVGVFPSIGDEAFGITIAEAMSSGLPVIASHVGGIPEVVGNEETCGLLVPPGNVELLAESMRKLALAPRLRQEMGDNARSRIEQLFTWQAAAQRMLIALDLV